MALSTVSSDPGGRPRPLRRVAEKATQSRRVRDLLRAEILRSGFPEAQLPGESELMTEFGVGRNVIRSALHALQQQGLISRVQGIGTFVVLRKSRHNVINGGVQASMDPLVQFETHVLAARHARAGATVGARLGVSSHHRCLVVDILNTINGQPVMAGSSYLPDFVDYPELDAIIARGRWRGDWYDALLRAGMSAQERDLTFEATVADELVAEDLGLCPGDPVLFVERCLQRSDGTRFEYGFSHLRGDLFAIAHHVVAPLSQAPFVISPQKEL